MNWQRQLDKWPLHPALCTGLFVGLWFRDGRSYIEWGTGVPYLLLCVAVTLGIQAAGQFITRKPHLTSVTLTILLVVFWTFEPLCRWLNHLLGLVHLLALLRVRHLLAILLAGILGLLWWRRDQLARLSMHMNATFALLFAVTAIQILLAKGPASRLVLPQPTTVQTHVTPSKPLPDIYWVIFDAFTSVAELKKQWGLSSDELVAELRSLGFIVCEDARSNYDSTPYSIGSELEMNYIEPPGDLNPRQRYVYLRERIATAAVPRTLAVHGYEIVNLSPFDLPTAQKHYTIPVIITIRPNLNDLLDDTPLRYRTPETAGLELRLVRKLKAAAKPDPSGSPRFVYTHVLLPHNPYQYDEEGRLLPPPYEPEDSLPGYLRQVRLVQKLTRNIASSVISNYPPDNPPVIIIQGDHGFRRLENDAHLEVALSCFLAIQMPGVEPSLVEAVHSPVNIFRLLMNEYFGTELPMLEDAHYHATESSLTPWKPAANSVKNHLPKP